MPKTQKTKTILSPVDELRTERRSKHNFNEKKRTIVPYKEEKEVNSTRISQRQIPKKSEPIAQQLIKHIKKPTETFDLS
jgi:hypothetical protein